MSIPQLPIVVNKIMPLKIKRNIKRMAIILLFFSDFNLFICFFYFFILIFIQIFIAIFLKIEYNLYLEGAKMTNNTKYREIRITYVHIVTLIIAFVAIGLLLFFLGYRIGKGSLEQRVQPEGKINNKTIVKVSDDNNTNIKEKATSNKVIKQKKQPTSEIDKELQMHNTLEMTENVKKKPLKKNIKVIKPQKITRSTYYAIQIGAFRDHKGAKKEAQRFSKKYSTEIVKSGNLYKVRIGSFKTEKKANLEIKKNPKLKGCYPVKIKR